jgi:hypothetical protein
MSARISIGNEKRDEADMHGQFMRANPESRNLGVCGIFDPNRGPHDRPVNR